MAKHSIQHSFVSEDDNMLVLFELVEGQVVSLILKFRGGEEIELSPQELVDYAATLNQSAEWIMALGMKWEEADEPETASPVAN